MRRALVSEPGLRRGVAAALALHYPQVDLAIQQCLIQRFRYIRNFPAAVRFQGRQPKETPAHTSHPWPKHHLPGQAPSQLGIPIIAS